MNHWPHKDKIWVLTSDLSAFYYYCVENAMTNLDRTIVSLFVIKVLWLKNDEIKHFWIELKEQFLSEFRGDDTLFEFIPIGNVPSDSFSRSKISCPHGGPLYKLSIGCCACLHLFIANTPNTHLWVKGFLLPVLVLHQNDFFMNKTWL